MKTIMIIGAGFSGAVTAVQLLRRPCPQGVRVLLVNRSGPMARGLAYGTRSPSHILNVPAGNMSALADDGDHFLRFCQSFDPDITASSFISRRTYGVYLERLLEEEERRAADGHVLQRLVGEVTEVGDGGDGGPCRVSFADGRCFEVDHVVLAMGHFPPNNPPLTDAGFYASARFVRDPWAPGALEHLDPGLPTLLLGTGLTAVDVAMSLLNRDGDGMIYAVSRRGLLPQAHRPLRGVAYAPPPDLIERLGARVRQGLRALREHVDEVVAQGVDWRDVVAALRPSTQALWQRLPASEKARFLRHVQPYWDSHRHRLAPQVAAGLHEAIACGAIQLLAARVMAYEERATGVGALLRLRGSGVERVLDVAQVVNCTGPSSNLRRVEDRLVQRLLGQGLIRSDALGLGLDVADDGAVVGADGRPSRSLYYVGPLLKARYWEATAVPELRGVALRLAQTLLPF